MIRQPTHDEARADLAAAYLAARLLTAMFQSQETVRQCGGVPAARRIVAALRQHSARALLCPEAFTPVELEQLAIGAASGPILRTMLDEAERQLAAAR